ncbi:MAG: hypothetical protein U9Q78_04700 [Chloroflexota bacterium]|nr:hypothetical protein [Chloroflexota bacterium]
MLVLLQLVEEYDLWLYGLCALVFLFYIRIAWRARRERASAFFGLEKEMATSHLLRGLSGAFLCCLAAGGIYYVSNHLAPEFELPEAQGAEPTIVIPTPIPSPTPGPPTSPPPTRRPRVVHTVKSTSTPSATATPEILPPSCPNPGAQLTAPGVNQVLQGPVQVKGTANLQDFDYYKFEFRAAGSEAEWAFLQRQDKPVVNGVLGTWDVSALPSGEYEFRLVVVRKDGNYKICATQVIVQH